MIALGLDLSLRRTGWARVESFGVPSIPFEVEAGTIATLPGLRVLKPLQRTKRKQYTRLPADTGGRIAKITSELERLTYLDDRPDLIVIESPSLGSAGSTTNLSQLSGLYWHTVAQLCEHYPIAAVAPATRAKYATGDGRADKKSVVAATVARYELGFDQEDEIDAFVLAAMGLRHLRAPLEQELPAECLDAMSTVLWP